MPERETRPDLSEIQIVVDQLGEWAESGVYSAEQLLEERKSELVRVNILDDFVKSIMLIEGSMSTYRAVANGHISAGSAVVVSRVHSPKSHEADIMAYSSHQQAQQLELIKDLYTVKETAAMSGLSRTYLYSEVKHGSLNSVRTGRRIRIKRADVLQLIDRLAAKGQSKSQGE